MGDELRVPPATLAEIRSELGKGRDALEGTASSTPSGIDGGDMTAMLSAMMSTLLDLAGSVSEGLAAVSAQVGEAGTSFWETDADVAATYGGPGGPRAD